jgi:putative transposase
MPQREHKGRILVKEDYIAFMPKQNLRTALHNLAVAIEYYNENHPHSGLKMRSPREFRSAQTATA